MITNIQAFRCPASRLSKVQPLPRAPLTPAFIVCFDTYGKRTYQIFYFVLNKCELYICSMLKTTLLLLLFHILVVNNWKTLIFVYYFSQSPTLVGSDASEMHKHLNPDLYTIGVIWSRRMDLEL